MSAATATFHTTPIYTGVKMATPQNNHQLRPELEQIVEDILGLRALADTTGFMTFKSQREILARLSPVDQAAIGRELKKREAQTK